MRSTEALAFASLFGVLTFAAPAQEPTPALPSSFFKARRQALIKTLGEGIVVIRGASRRSDMAKFYQDHDFYYLTGVQQQNAALILFCETGKDMLLVEPYSRWTAQWEGSRLVPNEASAKKAKFDEVGNYRSLRRILRKHLEVGEGQTPPKVWTTFAPQPNQTSTPGSASTGASAMTSDRFDRRPSRERAFRDNLAKLFEGIQIQNVDRVLRGMRGVKQGEEIERVRAATRIAAAGIAEAMKSTVPGIYEFQIAAAARYVFDRMGAGPDAYAAIVGAGRNGCVLHYSANNKKARDGELVVMDYAPTVQGYASDVTRTFPVNGKFTAAQRKLVQDVYDVQEILIAMVKPGASLRQIGQRCSRELMKRGYRSAHGPCHHVGLAVHDVGGDRLRPGMLITVEPGAYLTRKGMGCRIEDVILVTEDGHVNLSGHLPARPDDIEKLMREKGVHQAAVGLSSVPPAAGRGASKTGAGNDGK
jgi:Xaa-Pro aminopeptidase